MKKRLIGFGLGLLASTSILVITAGISLLLAMTIIGLLFVPLVVLAGGFVAAVAPIYGFIDPDGLNAAIQKRKVARSASGV